MIYIATNAVPILLATLAGLLVGVGYAVVAGRARTGRVGLTLLLAFGAEFWLSSILAGALIVAPQQAAPWVMALGSAVVIWIGFVLPTTVVGYAFRRQRASVIAGDALHWLAVMLAEAAVLQTVGLVRP